ncbi:hypothetical protein QYH69_22355 [Paraburkholderia sp. SARCC-3016]|uniref:hypothetical protein n=1 Tax=Paraburkholderia sp. SARCC-3016 TaxID=3058611 RepID=UPI002806CD9D|nr:hypothetical protein [Paraburkholderia sp. SARCC-3016]MDQ7979988.1 hypothetical protein [Paraburkholderia sp. SARCC-3016]
MEDFDYLAPDSAAAWLEGRGDGRFERYEQFYRLERSSSEDFDLESANEGYAEWAGRQLPRLTAMISGPWFGRVVVAFFSCYMAAQTVPMLASRVPFPTGAMLVVAFIGLRIFHRKRRVRR